MKTQLIIRILGPRIPAFDVVIGKIGDDGSFHPFDITKVQAPFLSSVTMDSLLGTQAYVKASDLDTLLRDVIDDVEDAHFLPELIVFNLKSDYEPKEEDPKEVVGC